MTAMLSALRDSAPTTDDLEPSPAAEDADLLTRAEDNMDRARELMGGYADAGFLLNVAQVQASIALARAAARLADLYRRP